MQIMGTAQSEVLRDTANRDRIASGGGGDLIVLARDGKTDTILDFQNSLDRIDLTAFNITWSEVQVKKTGDLSFTLTMRGERLKLELSALESQESVPLTAIDADDFVFAPGAAAPNPHLILDYTGPGTLTGTDQPDVFAVLRDSDRDVIKDFDPNHDRIDLSSFDTSFEELRFTDRKPGKIIIHLGSETLVVRDVSRDMMSGDFVADDFIF